MPRSDEEWTGRREVLTLQMVKHRERACRTGASNDASGAGNRARHAEDRLIGGAPAQARPSALR